MILEFKLTYTFDDVTLKCTFCNYKVKFNNKFNLKGKINGVFYRQFDREPVPAKQWLHLLRKNSSTFDVSFYWWYSLTIKAVEIFVTVGKKHDRGLDRFFDLGYELRRTEHRLIFSWLQTPSNFNDVSSPHFWRCSNYRSLLIAKNLE